jgi:DNA-binding NarL/FixJ family response regulator
MGANLHLATPPADPRRLGPITVLLADDHHAVRRGLRLLLEREDDLSVVAEAEDLTTVIRYMHGHRPRVLVIDVRMPNGSSVNSIRRLRKELPETQVVVLTMDNSPLFAQRTLDEGAVGFVLKDRAELELPEAIRAASRGDEYVSTHIAGGLDALRRAVSQDGLTPRETEVLRLIALGYTSAEIAGRLHLSRRTVETHRAQLYRTLGMTTRAELVAYALKRKLIGA